MKILKSYGIIVTKINSELGATSAFALPALESFNFKVSVPSGNISKTALILKVKEVA